MISQRWRALAGLPLPLALLLALACGSLAQEKSVHPGINKR